MNRVSTTKAASVGRKVQTGFVRSYAVGILGGGMAVLIFLLVRAS
jgi:hypothetical protein